MKQDHPSAPPCLQIPELDSPAPSASPTRNPELRHFTHLQAQSANHAHSALPNRAEATVAYPETRLNRPASIHIFPLSALRTPSPRKPAA